VVAERAGEERVQITGHLLLGRRFPLALSTAHRVKVTLKRNVVQSALVFFLMHTPWRTSLVPVTR